MRHLANPVKAKLFQRYFKTGPGDYGAGDKFLGLMVPVQRILAKKYLDLNLTELSQLIKSVWHEERLTALLILTIQFPRANEEMQTKIFNFYLKNIKYINNWDLIDLSAPRILGVYLWPRDKNVLLALAKKNHLWSKRAAILATFYFIYQGDCAWSLKLAKLLLRDKHDLMHKAVGWMLREVGKRCGEDVEKEFLDKYATRMPRTMLRYAIEKFSEKERKKYLKM